MNELKPFVAIFNGGLFGGESYFEAIPDVPESSIDSIKSKLYDVVKEHGFLSSRKNPKKISITVESIHIKDGKLERRPYGTYDIQPPMAKMTSIEFNEELSLSLRDIPKEFRHFFSIIVFSLEGTRGYKETIEELKDLIIIFKQGLNDYQNYQDRLKTRFTSNCDCDR
jgi:hypothetical protein